MSINNYFFNILKNYQKQAFSQRDKGNKFETLIQAYLQTDPLYKDQFEKVWLWSDFPARKDFGGNDLGIDLVAKLYNDDYWAIQCKFFAEDTTIDKSAVDSFLSTSSREFMDENLQKKVFSNRLWIDTTGKPFGKNAEETIKNLTIPFQKINLYQLANSPIDWEKLEQGLKGENAILEKKTLFDHQKFALQKTNEHFKTNERGKLIMACGTGKTFTSLKIAENETNSEGLVLFLVPSIALLGQSLREWTAESSVKINAICICSDANVSKQKQSNDEGDINTSDLALPASTNVHNILRQFEHIKIHKKDKEKSMTVVFSTYQSIDVIAETQKQLLKKNNEFGIFDLIICDEAHRTTGIKIANEDESHFTKVHTNEFIKAKKRMYMTATPRLYGDDAKSKANRHDAVLCSMDDEKIYGTEMYRIGFGEAVERGLLTEYKVLILTLDENLIPAEIQEMIAQNTDKEVNTEITAKIIGCIKAFSKQVVGDDGTITNSDPQLMKTAVAFTSKIKDSKAITKLFNDINETYPKITSEKADNLVSVSSQHVDGTMQITEREERLNWLKNSDTENQCRILTNARCLSEGVDVPSLDAVIFLSSRDSQVDVVQSVGRVMRKAPNKKYGYIIIPIVIPANVEPDHALDDNKKYKIVWDVLNALRAHDETFNTIINQIELNNKKSDKINVVSPSKTDGTGEIDPEKTKQIQEQLAIQFKGLQKYIFAKIVQKVGDKRYWEQWAKDVALIAEKYVDKITHFVNTKEEQKNAFNQFLSGLRKNINPSISQTEAIEMLAQHLITKPVFEALFEGYSFVQNNPVSISMQKIIEALENQNLEQDTETLQKFYDSVKKRAEKIDNAQGKQKIIIELYDKFFKNAFPKMVEKLGIVYTPTEVVDFIIHSVENILNKEFGRHISDENIHILDPFTGTGTFMVRLLQSGLIKKEDLYRKFTKELHANEIVLLAYYIAAINMETAFYDLTEKQNYTTFEGIVLTDTFQLSEKEVQELTFKEYLKENNQKIQAQKKAPLRIIIGNPPYSVGQKSANDNAQNQKYEHLDSRIAETYAKGSQATSLKALYDSYIKAFRWASDRLDKENGGIIAFVTNGAWLDSNGMDGFRKIIEKEFTSIYVFNLRGNQRTSGELSRKEGGKIFGSGSRTPVSLTFLVRNPNKKTEKAEIFYYDIGDYHNREQKLNILTTKKSIDNLTFQNLEPNEQGDWIAQRNEGFENYLPLAPEKKLDLKTKSFFVSMAIGIVTARDSWVYNFSKEMLEAKVKATIDFYNEQRILFLEKKRNVEETVNIENFIDTNPLKISWSRSLRNNIGRNKEYIYNPENIKMALYRPFCKNNLYFHKDLVNDMAVVPDFLRKKENLIICVSGASSSKGFSTLITDEIPDFSIVSTTQCFPLYYYESIVKDQANIFGKVNIDYVRRDGISNFILTQARKQYGNMVQKEDIFYYVYGFLHSPNYKETFANDLKKMLPRLPLVEEAKDFWAFSKAGRQLAELHLNYETYQKPQGVVLLIKEGMFINYEVIKMRFGKKDINGKNETDKSVIAYNSQISIENIPLRAYEYIVNGKSAIEWIMERYQITTHKESQITNNPNDWATEQGNKKYILDLLLSVINVSLQTLDIVEKLPALEF